MKKINRIIIKHLIDEDSVLVLNTADLSYLGRFSNEKGEFAIEHEVNVWGRVTYFNADNVENFKQARQNYKRMIDYNNGKWWMIGVVAEAEIETGNMNCKLKNTIKSSGLWGIDNDCEDDDIKDTEDYQIEELKDVLRKLGFSKLQIKKAPIEREE